MSVCSAQRTVPGSASGRGSSGRTATERRRASAETALAMCRVLGGLRQLVRNSRVGAGDPSARAALRLALSVLLRLLAPFLPYATEEVWSWWQEGSVHRATWPKAEELALGQPGDPAVLTTVGAALGAVRKAKSEAKVGMRTEVSQILIAGPSATLDKLRAGEGDLRAAGRITGEVTYAEGEELAIRDVMLVAPTP